jgi:hypothetical protein
MKKAKLAPGVRKSVAVQALTVAILIKCLQQEPCSYAELAEETGMTVRTISRWICEFKRQKLVYVAVLEPNSHGHRRISCWAWGCKPDAKVKYDRRARDARYAANKRLRKMSNAICATTV